MAWHEEWDHRVDPDSGEVLENASTGTTPELTHAALLESLKVLHPPRALMFDPETSVADVLTKMVATRSSCVLVVERDQVTGIFTERDVLIRLHGDLAGQRLEKFPIREVMTPDPECLEDSDSIAYALNKMSVGGYRHIPLVAHDAKGNFAPCIVSVRNVVGYLADFFPDVVYNLPPKPIRRGTERFGA